MNSQVTFSNDSEITKMRYKWENVMKPRIFFMVGTVFVLGLLRSLTCMAQFEIVPDHFEPPTAEQATRAGSLQGSFTLLHQVNYAGLTLPAGNYSLSILPRGGWNLVILRPKGTAASVQARIKCPSGLDHPTTLILEGSGEQSVLTAISFEQQQTILHLQGGGSGTGSAGSEQVPVSYTSRARTPH
jgi:hypothetical protein